MQSPANFPNFHEEHFFRPTTINTRELGWEMMFPKIP